MNRATVHQSDHSHQRATPIVKAMRWPFPIIWSIPILAAGLAGYYIWDRYINRGPLLTITFVDATGLKPQQSQLVHLGVSIGEVEDIQLSPDATKVIVQLRLKPRQDSFAKKGATFWIVRPQISMQQVSGLGTLLSGPYIDGNPGDGDTQTEFTGLQNAPVALEDGLRIVLKAPRLDHLQADSPIYYHGIEVGMIESVELDAEGDSADVNAFIRKRFSPLVRANSQFWVISGVDVKGGIFTGVQMKVESLRALLSGGVGFATPEDNMGDQAQNGSLFQLHDESKKDWLDWAPKIPIGPDDSQTQPAEPNPAQAAQAIR